MNAPATVRAADVRARARSARSARSGTPAARRRRGSSRLAEMLPCIHGSHTSRNARGANSAMKSRLAGSFPKRPHRMRFRFHSDSGTLAGSPDSSGLPDRAGRDLIAQLAARPTMIGRGGRSPRTASEPASSMRNNDHGPLRSSTEGVPPSIGNDCDRRVRYRSRPLHGSWRSVRRRWRRWRRAAPAKGLGAVGAGTRRAETTVPPVSNLARPPAQDSGDASPMLPSAALPPAWKNASRIPPRAGTRAASSATDKRLPQRPAARSTARFDVSACGARYWLKNLSITPFGLNMRAKSASGTSRSLPRVNG